MHKNLPREKCELCHKFIYTHDVALVCNLDLKIYHAKCLKIENDAAIELQNTSDWFCPCCLRSIFPHFDDSANDKNNYAETCFSCKKLISSTKHRVANCILCNNRCHSKCISVTELCYNFL